MPGGVPRDQAADYSPGLTDRVPQTRLPDDLKADLKAAKRPAPGHAEMISPHWVAQVNVSAALVVAPPGAWPAEQFEMAQPARRRELG